MSKPTCPACTATVPPDSRFCALCGTALVPPPIAETQPFVQQADVNQGVDKVNQAKASLPKGIAEARFAPGEILGGRYRIISMLGKGGMGEVYQADDLALGQKVALKFISHRLARDPDRVAKFRNEVRIARRISHPFVCRVYDIGETGGDLFLSMEFVEGEDLASLLSKIGRIPEERAIVMAFQLCQGLAAAHEQGVIHRDIKPHNVLLDRRGNVRITDFGLAGFVGEFRDDELRDGTPAYMSPEQLAGREVTVKSDLFSLGLVLYEIFTGKVALPARSEKGWSPRQEDVMPEQPSAQVSQLSPAVNRVIVRCLDREPDNRPPSALAVLAELPGGDPLHAAKVLGETPAPELVADAAVHRSLAPPVAISMLVACLCGLALALWMGSQTSVMSQAEVREPAVLAHQAREALMALGYINPTRPAVDRAFNFDFNFEVAREIARNDKSAYADSVEFWYRESSQRLLPSQQWNHVATQYDPPQNEPEMVLVILNGQGRLIRFEASASRQISTSQSETTTQESWEPILSELIGVDLATFVKAEAELIPPAFADQRFAWTCPQNMPQIRVERVEAAFLGKSPTYVRVIPKGMLPATVAMPPIRSRITLPGLAFGLSLYTGVTFLAWRNLRLGRGDRRGAYRLALLVFVTAMLSWLLLACHASAGSVSYLVIRVAMNHVSVAFMTWLVYVAVEPEVRRHWPHVMITWSRVLLGRLEDATLGRSILIGVSSGVTAVLLGQFLVLLPQWLPIPVQQPTLSDSRLLMGVTPVLSFILSEMLLAAIFSSLISLFLLLLLKTVFRWQWLAMLIALAIVGAGMFGQASLAEGIWLFILCLFTIMLLAKADLVAAIVFAMVATLHRFPLTSDISAWYANSGMLGLAVVAALAGWGCWSSMEGRKCLSYRFTNPVLSS